MDREHQIWKLARRLIGKHAASARDVAHERVGKVLATGDYESARLWVDTAEAVSTMMAGETRRRSRADPSLRDVLGGAVTIAVMDADAVDRGELEAMLRQASMKLR